MTFWVWIAPVVFAIRHGVYALPGDTYDHEPWSQVLPYEATKFSLCAGLFTTIGVGLLSWRAKREARLAQLTRQMQPHFLFNALNTISSLMHTDVARGYAAIMEERFAGRVTIDWDIDPTLLPTPMPAISLQPLLENMFKHTVERRRGSTAIPVSAQRLDAMLVLRVDDDAGTLDAGGSPVAPGIALANLRTRPEALHGERASVALQALSPAGVRAEMRLPCAS